MNEEVYIKLNEIFRDVLELEEIELNPSSSAEDYDNWDSLAHITIIAAIESEFLISFALGEIEDLQNVGNIVDMIISKNS